MKAIFRTTYGSADIPELLFELGAGSAQWASRVPLFDLTLVPNLGTSLPEMGTKVTNVISALFPGTRRKVLALFFLNPAQQYYFSEVIRLTGTRQGVVQRELKTLTDAGILSAEMRGRQRFYSVNKDNPIFPDLRNIVFKTFGVIGRVQEALKSLEKNINVAFVYGSFARGEEGADSDVDLFIVGRAPLDEIVSALSGVENAIGREINPSLFSATEFKSKFSQRNHFIRSIMKSEKEFIIGTEDELGRLAEK